MKPRYAIVKVQEKCPAGWNLEPSFCCEECKECKVAENYGDTKEQLVNKVAQAIKRKLKGGLILRNTKINETYNVQKTISAKVVAKEIVEFLGVKE